MQNERPRALLVRTAIASLTFLAAGSNLAHTANAQTPAGAIERITHTLEQQVESRRLAASTAVETEMTLAHRYQLDRAHIALISGSERRIGRIWLARHEWAGRRSAPASVGFTAQRK